MGEDDTAQMMLEAFSDSILGFHPTIWLKALDKRIVEGTAGRGGLEAFMQFFDNVDLVPGLSELRSSIKDNSLKFETALSMCSQESLKRPYSHRESEVIINLGAVCPKCGSEEPYLSCGKKCPVCGKAKLELLYYRLLREVVDLYPRDDLLPETILMYHAYNWLADAYVDTYVALNLILKRTAELYGWGKFKLGKKEIKNIIDEYFLGSQTGETKIPREEKEVLQFIVRGNLAGVPVEKAEKVIRLATELVKYGYLYQVLKAKGARYRYKIIERKYAKIYDEVNKHIRLALSDISVLGGEGEATAGKELIKKVRGGHYYPCLKLRRDCWITGEIGWELLLEPMALPVFPRADRGALTAVYGRVGSGKTTLLSSIISYGVLNRRELVFVPLNDKSNSYSLAFMPMFPYKRRERELTKLINFLEKAFEVKPQGLPTLTLNILREGEEPPDSEAHPPTIYDRIIRVEDPRGFTIDFDIILSWLKEIASEYGYSRPVGIINVRNMDRLFTGANINIDVQIATQMLALFDKWRKSNLNYPARVVIDEISYLAPSQVTVYASDAVRSGGMVSDFLKESRRSLLAIDVATQRPLEVLPEIRASAINVLFRDLSKDKARSEIEFMLDSLQLKDPEIRDVVREINDAGKLRKFYWFWYHRPSRLIEVIKPSPPVFCLQDPRTTNLRLIKAYEKHSGQKVLLERWSEVPSVKAEEEDVSALPFIG